MTVFEEGILASVAAEVGIDPDYGDYFDSRLMSIINRVFFELYQCNIGPKEGFILEDDTQTWEDYNCKQCITKFAAIEYVKKKTHLLFDPPTSNSTLSVLQEELKELQFRLGIEEDDS